MKTRDFVILGVFVLIVGLSFLFVSIFSEKGKSANVYVKGELVKEIDLSVNDEYQIQEDFVLIVENGKIRVKETNCSDQTCLHMGETNSSSKPLLCVPNGIYVEVEGNIEDVIIG